MATKRYTEAQKRSIKKYMETKHVMRITVPQTVYETYIRIAKQRGFSSLTQFVIYCIEKEIKQKLSKEENNDVTTSTANDI